jgi:hypothetical protein
MLRNLLFLPCVLAQSATLSPSPSSTGSINICSSSGGTFNLPSDGLFVDLFTNTGAGAGTSNYNDNLNCVYYVTGLSGNSFRLDFLAFSTERSLDIFRVYDYQGGTLDQTFSGSRGRFSVTVPTGVSSLRFSFTTDSSVTSTGVFVRLGPATASASARPGSGPGGGADAAISINGGAIAGIVIGVLFVVVVIPVIICVACCGGVAAACSACAHSNHHAQHTYKPDSVVVMQNPVGQFASSACAEMLLPPLAICPLFIPRASSPPLPAPAGLPLPPLGQPVYANDHPPPNFPMQQYPPPAQYGYPPPAAYPPQPFPPPLYGSSNVYPLMSAPPPHPGRLV